MPIYEYRCETCGRRVSVFTRSINTPVEAVCNHCGSDNLHRLVSRVAFIRSEESRLESLEDPSAYGDLDEADPESLARFMRRMSRETGEEMGPEFDEMIDRLEAGQSPEEIEDAMPDMGGALDDEPPMDFE